MDVITITGTVQVDTSTVDALNVLAHYFGSKPAKLSQVLSGGLFCFRLLILESTVEQELLKSPFVMGVMQLDTRRSMNEVQFGPQSFLGSVAALSRFLRSEFRFSDFIILGFWENGLYSSYTQNWSGAILRAG